MTSLGSYLDSCPLQQVVLFWGALEALGGELEGVSHWRWVLEAYCLWFLLFILCGLSTGTFPSPTPMNHLYKPSPSTFSPQASQLFQTSSLPSLFMSTHHASWHPHKGVLLRCALSTLSPCPLFLLQFRSHFAQQPAFPCSRS